MSRSLPWSLLFCSSPEREVREERDVDDGDWAGVCSGETDAELAEEAAIESEVTDLDRRVLREMTVADIVEGAAEESKMVN